MTTLRSNRRTSFGMKCVQCSNELIAPESSEFWGDGRAYHIWHCSKCSCCFGSLVLIPTNTKSIKDIRATEDIWRSPLLAG
jgi:hypothetical protein